MNLSKETIKAIEALKQHDRMVSDVHTQEKLEKACADRQMLLSAVRIHISRDLDVSLCEQPFAPGETVFYDANSKVRHPSRVASWEHGEKMTVGRSSELDVMTNKWIFRPDELTRTPPPPIPFPVGSFVKVQIFRTKSIFEVLAIGEQRFSDGQKTEYRKCKFVSYSDGADVVDGPRDLLFQPESLLEDDETRAYAERAKAKAETT